MSSTTAPTTLELVEIAGLADRAIATMSLSGEIDSLTAPRVHSDLAAMLDRPAIRTVVLDLQHVTFMSSAGIGLLLQTSRKADEKAVDLRLIAEPDGPVVRSLRMTGLVDTLPLYPTHNDACKTRRSHQGSNPATTR